jgi:4-hydroxybenzoate polyprenyltransferase
MSKVLEMDKKKLIAYIRLERPQFSLISFLTACAGMIFAYKGVPNIRSLLAVGFLFWFIKKM